MILKTGHFESEELLTQLRQQVRADLGAFAVPDFILVAIISPCCSQQVSDGLPKTRSGKIMRRILRKIAESKVRVNILICIIKHLLTVSTTNSGMCPRLPSRWPWKTSPTATASDMSRTKKRANDCALIIFKIKPENVQSILDGVLSGSWNPFIPRAELCGGV